MKNIAITCLVLVAVCVGLQAKKTVKAPYFMAASGSQLEIEKVTLGKDTTWVDAKNIYGLGRRCENRFDNGFAGCRKKICIFGWRWLF